MRKICYIINPKSGVKGKANIPSLIKQLTDRSAIEFEICYTKAPKHAIELSRRAAQQGADTVVAVGGDGSVNEVARGITGSSSALGIIPTGSGNGMARHLKIPLNVSEAIHVINIGRKELIDTLNINDSSNEGVKNNEFCVGTVGIGFDAHIAHLFSKAGKRGYLTYVKLVLTEFYKYKPKIHELVINGKTVSKECFLLTFANSSQFGNNAVIAPFANVKDGILDISIMKKFPFLFAPALIWRLMNNTIHKSRFFELMRGQEVFVRNNGILNGHIDGEPVTFNGDLLVKIIPESLNVIVPYRL